jgi:hypothetical protein
MTASPQLMDLIDEMDLLYDKFMTAVGNEVSIDTEFVSDFVADQMDKVKSFLDKSIERGRQIETAERKARRRLLIAAATAKIDVEDV